MNHITCSSTNTVLSQDTIQSEKVSEQADTELKLNSLMPDVPLINQNQEQVYFYSDLVKGKTVAINFVYTTCQLVCSMQGKNFAKVQDLIGERLGKDIYLITISKNPRIDTPELMSEWAQNYNPKTGWQILTGNPEDVKKVIQPFIGGFVQQMEHSPVIYIINEEKDITKSIHGLNPPERVAELLIATADSPSADHKNNEK